MPAEPCRAPFAAFPTPTHSIHHQLSVGVGFVGFGAPGPPRRRALCLCRVLAVAATAASCAFPSPCAHLTPFSLRQCVPLRPRTRSSPSLPRLRCVLCPESPCEGATRCGGFSAAPSWGRFRGVSSGGKHRRLCGVLAEGVGGVPVQPRVQSGTTTRSSSEKQGTKCAVQCSAVQCRVLSMPPAHILTLTHSNVSLHCRQRDEHEPFLRFFSVSPKVVSGCRLPLPHSLCFRCSLPLPSF